jgi:hypothetical protein
MRTLIKLFKILLILGITLLVYIVYHKNNNSLDLKLLNNIKTTPTVTLQEISQTSQYDKNSIDDLHRKIYNYIYLGTKNMQPISLQSTHPDYKDIIKLLAKDGSNIEPTPTSKYQNDKHILQTLNSNYKVSIRSVYNSGYDFLKEAIDKDYLFAFTGAYTSSFKRAVGVFAIDGKILNPAIRDWGGVLLIKDGVAQIIDARNINIGFKKLNILKSVDDLKVFFNWIETNDLSILQSHLIVNNGRVAVKSRNKRLFRRRVIFEDDNGLLHIYDSLGKKITLFQLSNILVKKYRAVRAINLDMGAYDYAYRYINRNTEKIGLLDKTNILSNIIQIERK